MENQHTVSDIGRNTIQKTKDKAEKNQILFLRLLQYAIIQYPYKKTLQTSVLKITTKATGITKQILRNAQKKIASFIFLKNTFILAGTCFLSLVFFQHSLVAADSVSIKTTNPQNTTSQKRISVKVGTQGIVSNHSLAIAKGFLKEEFDKVGADLVVLQFDSGRDINNAFVSKSIDFGFLGTTPFVIGALSGLKVSVIYVDFIAQNAEGLAIKKGTFSSIQDLKGQKVALPFGTSAHYAFLQTLHIHGVNPKDVTLLDLSPSDIFAAWERDDIKAAYVWDLTLSALKDKVLLSSDKDLANQGIILSDLTAARNEFLNAYPQIAKAYIRAMERAYEYRLKEPKDAAKLLAKYFRIPENIAAYQLSIEATKPLSTKDLKGELFFGEVKSLKGDSPHSYFAKNLQSIAQFLYTQKLIRKLPPPNVFDSLVNASFLD